MTNKIKTILFLILLITSSCASTKFYKTTECSINQEIIISKLKKQKVTAKDITINNYRKGNGTCDIFSLTTDKWKGVKSNLNEVSIPVLKVGEDIFINAFFLNGELRKEFDYQSSMKNIDSAIRAFRTEKQNLFEEKTLKEIEKYYKKGIEVFPKGRLWINK